MGGGVGQAGGGLSGAIAGAYLGSFIPIPGVGTIIGAAIGSAIGSYAGNQVDLALTKPVEGPRLGDVQVSTATYGLPIPRGWGVTRLPGNMIWTSGIEENKNPVSGKKGKGLKGPGAINFSYSASFAFAFACGPADRVLRIWADGKPVYDIGGPVGEDTGATLFQAGMGNVVFNHRFYPGTESQNADPLIAEDVGADLCPAFRGLCYIVCESVDLTIYGNRIPNISAEIAFSGAGSAVTTLLTTIPTGDPGGLPEGYFYNASMGAYDGIRGVVYRSANDVVSADGWQPSYVTFEYAAPMVQAKTVRLDALYEGTEFTYQQTSPGIEPGIHGMGSVDASMLYLHIGNINSDKLVAVDPVTQRVVAEWGIYGPGAAFGNYQATQRLGASVTKLTVGRLLTPAGVRDVVVGSYVFSNSPMVWLGPTTTLNGATDHTLQYLWGANDDANRLYPAYAGSPFTHSVAMEGKRSIGTTEFWYLQWVHFFNASPTLEVWRIAVTLGGVTPTFVGSYPTATFFTLDQGTGFEPSLANYDRANDQIIVHIGSDGVLTGTANAYKLVAIARDGSVAWQQDQTTFPVSFAAGYGDSRLLGSTYAYSAGLDLYQIDTRTGTQLATYDLPGGSATPLYMQAYDSLTGFIWNQGATAYQRFFLNIGQGGTVPLSTVVSDLCLACGLAAADFDVSELAGDLVRGFISTPESARNPINHLSGIYFFDVVESEDKLFFRKRGRTPVATVAYADVLRLTDGVALQPSRQQAWEIPRAVTIRYPDIETAHQQGTQRYGRSQNPVPVRVVQSVGEMNIDTRLTLNADEAKTVAKRQLLTRWAERDSFGEVGVSPEYLALEPADVILLGMADGENVVRLRLDAVEVGADFSLRLNGVVEDGTLFAVTATADGGSGYVRPSLPGLYAVQPQLYSLPLLRDQDDTAGTGMLVYLAAGTYPGQTFGGAQYLISSTPTADFSALGSPVRTGAAWGVAENALGDVLDAGITDNDNSLTVTMAAGGDQLVTATRSQVLAGANPAALVNSDGEAEVIQYTTVTPLGFDRYRLDGLLRGRRGSEWATGRHSRGDRFLLLTTAALSIAQLDLAALNAPRFIKSMGLFDVLDYQPAYRATFGGTAEKPYAPSHIEGARDGSDNLTITWLRRSRIGGEWTEPEAVPLGEETEAYSVDVLDGSGAVLRTIAGLTAAEATYSAAEATADGLTPGDAVTVRVYQISATVGRGYAGEATI